MTGMRPFLSIITLDISKLNSDVKRNKLTEKILQNKHADTKVQTDCTFFERL